MQSHQAELPTLYSSQAANAGLEVRVKNPMTSMMRSMVLSQ
jgi:hypothetical protein